MYQSNYGRVVNDSLRSSTSLDNAPESDVLSIMREVMTCKANGLMFHESMSRCCHMMGLQGMKRLQRYKAQKDFIHLQKLQHYCIDVFQSNIDPDFNPDVPIPDDVKSYLTYYLDFEKGEYEHYGKLIKSLFDLGYAHEAEMVTCYLHSISKQIEKCNRWLQDFEKSDWDWAYIRVVDTHLHNKMKEKEDKYGYE